MRPRVRVHVMTLWRTKMGISKAEDDDGQLSHASWLGSSRTAARWLAEGITKAELQAAATGTGVKGSANHSRPTVTLNLLGAGAGHFGGRQRGSVNVHGRLPFKVCHS